MPGAKPGVDWDRIRIRYRAGEPIQQIATSLGGRVSKQAIWKRKEKEGWDDNGSTGPKGVNLPVARENTWLAYWRQAEYTPVGNKDSPERRAAILQSLDEGMPRATAAALAGITDDTLTAWQAADSAFSLQCEECTRRFERVKLAQIDAAGARGDWKADAYRLEKHPQLRATYGEQRSAGVNVQVVVNAPMPGQVVDITPGPEKDAIESTD